MALKKNCVPSVADNRCCPPWMADKDSYGNPERRTAGWVPGYARVFRPHRVGYAPVLCSIQRTRAISAAVCHRNLVRLQALATLAMIAKRHEFAGTTPDDNLVSRVRQIGEGLRQGTPIYLRPSAQGLLQETPADCLEVIEKAVNWEAEKLYGVENQGPFDEF